MPGLVPGIHVFPRVPLDVDGRDKPGHDAGDFLSHSSLGLWVPAFAGTTALCVARLSAANKNELNP